MKVAAYQAPLTACCLPDVIARIRERVDRCGAKGVEILCCPEGILGGAASLVALGAMALFILSNNGLPPEKGGPELVDDARACDRGLATTHGIHVVRTDVTGAHGPLTSYGSSAIVAPDGTVLAAAAPLEECLLISSVTIAA